MKKNQWSENIPDLSHYNSDEISRDAIIIYLNNMRIIETVIHKSEQEKSSLENYLSQMQSELNNLKYNSSKINPKQLNDTKNFLIYVFVGILIGCLLRACFGLIIVVFVNVFLSFLSDKFSSFNLIFSGIKFFGVIGAFIGGLAWKGEKDDSQRKISLKQEYEENIFQKQEEYDKMEQKYLPIISGLKKDISRYKKLAQDGYSINLIPYSSKPDTNCRCLHGVLFLYEFMSTSRESLTTALTHYKLDQIVSRLNDLIEAVNRVIENQNRIMYEQGQVLNQLKRNEKQLNKLNDYAEIAAHNSALQVEMNRESLYYQRIDYLKNW